MPLNETPGAAATGLTRGHKKKERTRRQLMAAAIDVIAERGEAFTISDVVARAEVSNGTFYNYFADRDELIDAVIPSVFGAVADEFGDAVSHEDPARRFATITALGFATAAAQPQAIQVVLRLDAVQQAVSDGDMVALMRADLRAGCEQGRFDVEHEAAAIDVIVGALLMVARRIVRGSADHAYQVAALAHLLRSLGLSVAEAAEIAEVAATEAAERQAEARSGAVGP